jgi:hypothetical protein
MRLALARLPFPLHLSVVEDTTCLPARQQRLGVSKVRSLRDMRTLDVRVAYDNGHDDMKLHRGA